MPITPAETPRAILDSLALHIALLDETGTIRSVNRAWREFASTNGARPMSVCEGANYLRVCEQARGQDLNFARDFAAGLRAVIDGRRESFSMDYPCHEPHRQRWFRARVTSVHDSHPRQVVICHSDITARHLIDQSRDESEAILRSVFEFPTLEIGVVELSANDLWFVSVNEAAAKRMGRSPQEVAGQSANQLEVPARYTASFLEHGWRSVRTGTTTRFEYVEETPQGPRSVSVVARPIPPLTGTRPRIAFIAEEPSQRRQPAPSTAALDAEAEQQIERLRALRAIDSAINVGLELPAVLDVVLEQAVTQLGVDAAAVLLRAPHRPGLEYSRWRGYRWEPEPGLIVGRDSGLSASTFLDNDETSRRMARSENSPPPELAEREGFRSYWAIPIVVRGEVQGILEVGHRSMIHPDARWTMFLHTIAGRAASVIDRASLINTLRETNHRLLTAYEETIEGWSRAMDLRDHETELHSLRVTEMSVQLGREFGLSRDELIQIRRGALLHDIGKVGIPDQILLKPGPLDDEEMAIIRKHPEHAFSILSPIEFLRKALDIPYCHHERWDGSGYPRGLKGSQIPVAARIFAVVDVWDALSTDRPYRKALPSRQVRDELSSMAGKELDPEIVEVFLKLLESNEAVRRYPVADHSA